MAVVIAQVGLADGSPPEGGRYLKDYDPDWVPRGTPRFQARMTGRAWWTDNLAEAKRFPDAAAALAEWKRQSSILPIRPWDGRPNRPLTAYTVTLEKVED